MERFGRWTAILFAIVLLAFASTLGQAQPAASTKAPAKKGGFANVFDKLAEGKDTIDLKSSAVAGKMREYLVEYAKTKGITNDKITRDQFAGFTDFLKTKLGQPANPFAAQPAGGKGGLAKSPQPAKDVGDPKLPEFGLQLRPTFSSQLTLPTDPDLERKLSAIPDYIGVKDWKAVTKALQEILDAPEDCFLPQDHKGVARWVSVKAEANRLLGTLPADGRLHYETMAGVTAAALLEDAKKNADLQKLGDVALRYFHTKAGREALDLLGTYNLDRGRFLMACVCFDRLLQRPDAEELSAVTLFKAAMAFRRHGETAKSEAVWTKLTEKAKDGKDLGLKKATLADLKKLIDQPMVASSGGPVAATGWTMFRGSPARESLAASKPLELKSLAKNWKALSVEEGSFGHSKISNAVDRMSNGGQPIVSGAVPLTLGDKILFRNQLGVRAVDAKSGRLAWYSTFNNGFDSLPQGSEATVHTWIDNYVNNAPTMLVENSTLGTLSTDGQRVYAIEDLVTPPFPNNYNTNPNVAVFRPINNPNPSTQNEELSRAINHNRLVALSLAKEGLVTWVAGGADDRDPLGNAIFLGPPLALGGRLYCLIEKDSELKLVCLAHKDGIGRQQAKPEVQWTQSLILYKKSAHLEIGRRTWAAPMAYDQGILVCPSNAGAVIGVDLLTHSLVWAHSYLAESKQPADMPNPLIGKRAIRPAVRYVPPKMAATWKAASPIIAEGKVIFTAPDGTHIECLNLHDGALLWKEAKLTDDHFVAGVYEGNVVIVGQRQVRALSMKDGKVRWTVDTGMPAGQGIAAGNIYYLPVRDGQGGGAAILALDVKKGSVAARINTPGNEVPGNLVIADGMLVSQTPTTVSVYSLTK
jgi:PQQ-like domain